MGLLLALDGCIGVLKPVGPIGQQEKQILFDALAIMLCIVVPTAIASLAFAWWFRASNTRANYTPDWGYSGRIEAITWSIPALTILFLGGITWIGAHDLDPAKPIESKVRSLPIQVVALDWKWLFIYPRQGVASINELVVPVGTPLEFKITSASVFNLFFVPQLGSSIYAMNGMVTTLNLEADRLGTYYGLSGHFSGDGFSDMKFDLTAVPADQFQDWVARAKSSGPALDDAAYRALLKQELGRPPMTYSSVQPRIFDAITSHALPDGDGPEAEAVDSKIEPKRPQVKG